MIGHTKVFCVDDINSTHYTTGERITMHKGEIYDCFCGFKLVNEEKFFFFIKILDENSEVCRRYICYHLNVVFEKPYPLDELENNLTIYSDCYTDLLQFFKEFMSVRKWRNYKIGEILK